MGLKGLTQPKDITIMIACGSLSTSASSSRKSWMEIASLLMEPLSCSRGRHVSRCSACISTVDTTHSLPPNPLRCMGRVLASCDTLQTRPSAFECQLCPLPALACRQPELTCPCLVGIFKALRGSMNIF